MSVHHHWRLIYRSGSSRGLSRCLVERTSATCSSARCRPLVHVPYDNQQNDCRHGYDYHLGAHVTTQSGDPAGSSVRARAFPAEITGAAVVGIPGNISMSPLSRSSAVPSTSTTGSGSTRSSPPKSPNSGNGSDLLFLHHQIAIKSSKIMATKRITKPRRFMRPPYQEIGSCAFIVPRKAAGEITWDGTYPVHNTARLAASDSSACARLIVSSVQPMPRSIARSGVASGP